MSLYFHIMLGNTFTNNQKMAYFNFNSFDTPLQIVSLQISLFML